METAYKAAELAAQARPMFGTTQEVVKAALRAAGKDAATVAEAKTIVKEFLEREVQ